ncbi:mRNA turnover and ribosome assembly protein [Agyrium rufum]|nr:mRNA turnover and ribosome assembly protein [Agyrium rufum]
MPRSKRNKVMPMTKTPKKRKELSKRMFSNIQACIPQYPYLYVFSVDNMRNNYLKNVRTQLSDSRMFFGKTKLTSIALQSGPSPASLKPLTTLLHGTVGLLFSPQPPSEIRDFFAHFHPASFARAGITSTRTFALPYGPVYSTGGQVALEHDVLLPHSLEPTLRKLGVPTKLVRGRIMLEGPGHRDKGMDGTMEIDGGLDEQDSGYLVCKEGQALGARETALLKMFGIEVAEFAVDVRGWWEKSTGDVWLLKNGVEELTAKGSASDGGLGTTLLASGGSEAIDRSLHRDDDEDDDDDENDYREG